MLNLASIGGGESPLLTSSGPSVRTLSETTVELCSVPSTQTSSGPNRRTLSRPNVKEHMPSADLEAGSGEAVAEGYHSDIDEVDPVARDVTPVLVGSGTGSGKA
eukprot:g42636.t1